jgi:hypothetical protein
MALFGLPFLLVGCIPILAGVAILFSHHAEIQITAAHLIAREHIGPFRFPRRRPLSAITALIVGPSNVVAPVGSPEAALHAIRVECSPPHKSLRAAWRYSPDTVAAVAQFLADELERHRRTITLRDDAPKSPVSLSFDLPKPEPALAPAARLPASELPPPQPANSTITFLPTPDALTFIIPRTGFRGTAGFFLLFALFWNTITCCVGGGFLVSWFQQPTLGDLFPFVFIFLFLAIGVGLALTAVQTAFRKAVLLASRDSLVFTQTGPIRNTEHQWSPVDLTAIRVENSGTEVNDRPLKQLQVHFTRNNAPSHRGVLTGRDETELRWLAATLRAFYRVDS